jgi:hypothetical protein
VRMFASQQIATRVQNISAARLVLDLDQSGRRPAAQSEKLMRA